MRDINCPTMGLVEDSTDGMMMMMMMMVTTLTMRTMTPMMGIAHDGDEMVGPMPFLSPILFSH
jgi:hypothetical protein